MGLAIEKCYFGNNSTNLNLMVGITAYKTITKDIITESFTKTGLWPMGFCFLDRFKKPNEKTTEENEETEETNISKRVPDEELWKK